MKKAGLVGLKFFILGLSIVLKSSNGQDAAFLDPSSAEIKFNYNVDRLKATETLAVTTLDTSQFADSETLQSSDGAIAIESSSQSQIVSSDQPPAADDSSVQAEQVEPIPDEPERVDSTSSLQSSTLVNHENIDTPIIDNQLFNESEPPEHSASSMDSQPTSDVSHTADSATPVEPNVHIVPLPTVQTDAASQTQGQTQPVNTTEDPPVDDKFATFEEWSAQVRAEQKSKLEQDGSPATQKGAGVVKVAKINRNNYASSECGSKILATNPEAENAKSILSNNKDEYMINPCHSKNWFVVELCEPVQIQSLELASFELFSSQPHRFTVYLSEWYPPKEWRVLASFEATEERGLQSFQIQDDIFVKYVKVDMVDHYGEEHYCPLTLFRVYGVALTDDEDDDSAQKTEEETSAENKDGEPTNLFKSAKDTVMSLVKKVLKVEGENATADDASSTNDTLGNKTADESLKPNISSSSTMLPCVPMATIISSSSSIVPLETIDANNTDKTSEPSQPTPAERTIVTRLADHEQPSSSHGPAGSHGDVTNLRSMIIKCCLCNTTKGEQRKADGRSVCLYIRLLMLSQPKNRNDEKVVLSANGVKESEVCTDTSQTDNKQESFITTQLSDHQLSAHKSSSLTNSVSTNQQIIKSRVMKKSMKSESSVGADSRPCTSHRIFNLEPSPKVFSSISRLGKMSDNIVNPRLITESVSSEGLVQTSPIVMTSFTADSISEHVTPSPSQDISQTDDGLAPAQPTVEGVSIPLPETVVEVTEATKDSVAFTESVAPETLVVIATGVSSTVIASDTPGSELKIIKANVTKPGKAEEKSLNLVRIPVNVVSKRETQIMRLSNRVKALELNVSLSSRFLEELSQRYRKKSEDLMKLLNSTNAKLVNATQVVSQKEESQQISVRQLESRVEELVESLSHMNERIDNLRKEISDRHLVWGVIEVMVALFLFFLCIYMNRPVVVPAVPTSVPPRTPHKRASPSRHLRQHSADDIITLQASGLSPKKKLSSEGCIDNLVDDLHIVEPVQGWITDFGKPPDGAKKRRRKRNKLVLTSSHSDLTDLAAVSAARVKKQANQDIVRSHFSSAGLLFAANTQYKRLPDVTDKHSHVKKCNHESLSMKSDKYQNHSSWRRKVSSEIIETKMGNCNNAQSSQHCLMSSLPCYQEKNVYQDKRWPAIKA